jgi:hypothetical protein
MYAASAKVSGDKDMASSFISGDWMKYVLVAFTFVTSLAYLAGAQNLVSWIFA